MAGVNCRIGSLESWFRNVADFYKVNCRIGSLENLRENGK